MNNGDHSPLPLERLVAEFKTAAKQLGTARWYVETLRELKDPNAKITRADPEVLMPIAEHLRGIVDSLRVQGVGAPIERLLRDDDPDVRATAAIAFADLSPELADAAGQSAYVGLPTDKMLELQRRARRRPPERPTLAELSDDDLVARFEDAAERESGSHFLDYLDDPADKDLQNEIVGEVWNIMRQLKARGLLVRLLPLLGSDDLTVRREAATACLRVDAPQAEAALESVARDGEYPDNINARAALANWRDKGQIVYGV
jgi:HEAT repeat protein